MNYNEVKLKRAAISMVLK